MIKAAEKNERSSERMSRPQEWWKMPGGNRERGAHDNDGEGKAQGKGRAQHGGKVATRRENHARGGWEREDMNASGRGDEERRNETHTYVRAEKRGRKYRAEDWQVRVSR